MIWYMCAFWLVKVCGSDFFSLGKESVIKGDRHSPIFSVHDTNLASCAGTCYKDSSCLFFVYTDSDQRCEGFVKFRTCGDAVDDGRKSGRNTDGPVYKQKCIKRCIIEHEKATYKLTFKTGMERRAGSKANLRVGINGPCGHVGTAIKNGKDIRLRRGRKSTFQFLGDDVCGVDSLDLAFADACHKDDWFIKYVIVEYEETATGDRARDRVSFQTNSWLSVSEGHDHTTGISCFYVPPVKIMFVYESELTECNPSQKCEHLKVNINPPFL